MSNDSNPPSSDELPFHQFRTTTPPHSEAVLSEASKANSATPIGPAKSKTSYTTGARHCEKVKEELKQEIHPSVMAEYNDSVRTGGPEFIEAKFPHVIFKMSEDSDRIKLVSDPNPEPIDPALFDMQTSNETQPVEPSPESSPEESSDVAQSTQPPPDTPKSSTDTANDIEDESNRTPEPPLRRRSTRRTTRKTPAAAVPATVAQSATNPVNSILSHLTHKGLYNNGMCRWVDWPATSEKGKEEELSKFLNKVVAEARAFLNGDKKLNECDDDWEYSARYANNTVPSEGAKRKPDISIIQRKYASKGSESSSWGGIRGFCELKSTLKDDKDEVIGQLAEYSRLCFGHEKARRFVLCFTIKNEAMQLVKFDRSGVVLSHEFNVHENPTDFLRIIVGMIIGDDYYLGLDPSFVVEEGKTWVYLNDKRYEFVKTLLLERTNRGRGTVALLVRRKDGKEMVIKDQWVDRSRKSKEPTMLRKLKSKGIEHIAKIEDHQIIHYMVDGIPVKDTTEYDRSSGSGIETRDHYRILITPYGDKLETFRSRKELISAFLDYVITIEELIEADVVHRDISPGNLILVKNEKDPKGPRKGYIIDFDYAIEQSRQDDDHAEGKRTGTYPFMSIAVLEGLDRAKDTHNYYHDLESLFYTFVWTCLTQKGPNSAHRPSTDFADKDSPIEEWVGKRYETSYGDIAAYKRSMMKSWDGFEVRVFLKMKKYFQATPFRLLFDGMLETLFRNHSRLLTTRMVKGEMIPAMSLADIPDDAKAIRYRERIKVFEEIKDLLIGILKLPEIETEDAKAVKRQQGIDSAKHQRAASGDASDIGPRWRDYRVDKLLPRGNETHHSDSLVKKATSQMRSKRENSSQITGKRTREVVADEAGPSTQRSATKRSKTSTGK